MPRLVFVNRFYAPDHAATGQLLTDLAEAAHAGGADVLVITGSGTAPCTTRNGVAIVRVAGNAPGDGIAHKATAFGRFYLGATRELWRQLRRGDTLVVLTDPPLFGCIAAVIATLTSARLVHWVQDIYPEVAVAVTRKRWLSLLTPVRNAAWRAADQCIAVSHEMAAVVRAAGVAADRVGVVANWAPARLAPPTPAEAAAVRREWQLQDKFVVAYSGNLGRVHEFGATLAAAGQLQEAQGAAFVFIGGGAQRPWVEAEARRRGLGNLRFLPPQPRERLAATLGAADVHLVTLRAGCESYVFPSKVYGIAAAGRPVVFVGPPRCELAQTIERTGIGFVVDGSSGDGLAALLRELMSHPNLVEAAAANARRYAEAHRAELRIREWLSLTAAAAC